MQRIIIAGTFVPQWMAELFYEPMAKALKARVVALAGLGLDHPASSVVNVGMFMDQSKPCQLIGHSQGGVIAALCDSMYDVDKIVTLGAPLKGLPYPSGPFLDFPGIKYLHSSNPALKKLRGAKHMLDICSAKDLLVPHEYAHLEGTNQICLDKPGHSLIPRNSNVISIVKEFLDG